MKIYQGHRIPHNGRVDTACDTLVCIFENNKRRPLPWRLDLYNHSPTGLNWGYAGSGPAQLALALLADVLDNPKEAVRLHQEFKRKVVTQLADIWQLSENIILGHVKEMSR